MRIKGILNIAFAVTVAVGAMLGGCSGSKGSGRTVIAVSYDSQKWLLEQIAGGDYDITVLLPPGRDPETYDPDMATMSKLSDAEAYFNTSTLGFESRMAEKVGETFKGVKTVNVAEGVSLISDTHAGMAGVSDNEEGHSHIAGDPHLLTSIVNARIISANMLNQLTAMNPDSASKYLKNYNALDERLYAASQRIDSVLRVGNAHGSVSTPITFAVMHPSLSYFARERGIAQYSLERDGKEVTPRQLKERIEEAKGKGAVILFYERGQNASAAEQAARELGVEAYPIYLNGGDFLLQLEELAKAISAASAKGNGQDAAKGAIQAPAKEVSQLPAKK